LALVGVAGVDWSRFGKLALRFGAPALARLHEFRQNELLPIPSLRADDTPPLRRKVRVFWDEYRTLSYHRKAPATLLGFADFLAQRWHLRHAWQVPIVGARLVLQQRRSLPR
jgi:hypothetical protein